MIKRFTALTAAALFGIGSLYAADVFEVLELKGPSEASSGEKITVNMTYKVVSVDQPVYLRPAAQYNFPDDKKAKNLAADQMAPWKIEKFKPGDILKQAATFTLPAGLTPGGRGSLRFMIYRQNTRSYARFTGKAPIYNFKVRSSSDLKLEKPAAGNSVPAVVIPLVDTAAVIDGKLNDALWQKAVTLKLAANSLTGKAVADPAQMKVASDGKNLYCALISPAAVKDQDIEKFAHHDGSLWKNDGLEVIIAPDSSSNDYMQFMADLADQRYDGFNADTAGFNPPWQSKAVRNSQNWVIEAAIPLSAIAANGATAGTVWRGDFFRTGKKYNTAWNATMGSHSALKQHGWLIFGSMQKALENRGKAFEAINSSSSQELQQLKKQYEAVKKSFAGLSVEKFAAVWEELDKLQKTFEQLQFAERFAASKLPLVIQWVNPYAGGVPRGSNSAFAGALNEEFFLQEVRDFALNITNISKQTLTVRCGLFSGKNGSFNPAAGSLDYLYMGIPDFAAKLFSVTNVAAFDGTAAGDALAPNPAGVFTVAPGAAVQLFITVKAPEKITRRKGALVIESIAEHKFAPVVLPLDFAVKGGKLDPALKPVSFGWDYMHTPILQDRSEYVRSHYAMLREYGFNTTMITGLRHLPRPRASAEGNIPEKLDYSKLHELIKFAGTDFDYYYIDIAIWNQHRQNRELFNLDFYDPAYGKAFKKWFRMLIDELAALNIPKTKLLVNPIDEAADKRAEIISGWIKSVDPEVKVIIDSANTNMEQLKNLDRFVDIWMPHMRSLPQEAFSDFHKYVQSTGKLRMAYYYSAGGEEKTKAPYGEYLLHFYRLFSQGFSGLGFWAAGQYYGDPWYRKAYPGTYDTSLIYPAASEAIPSRRLAAWRRGVQDLWLMRTAEKKLGKDTPAAEKLRKAAAETASFPTDSKRSEELRQYCREIIAQ